METEYRRDLSVPVTEDLMVLTTLKVPAGVQLSSVLVSPEPNPYQDMLRMFVCLDSKVIYNGPYIEDGLNVQIEDGLYDEDRVLIFSLSSVAGLDGIMFPFLTEAALKITVLGIHLANYVVLDDTQDGFDATFNIAWC